MKLIQQGAEAKIFLSGNFIIKDRIKKNYRIKEIDDKIRKSRTKKEIKLLEKASEKINSPKPIKTENIFQIKMPFIKGKKLSEHLDKFPLQKQKQILKIIGEEIAKLHNAGIIHGDLTTSNMILVSEDKFPQGWAVGERGEGKNKIFIIDFGLGFVSNKIEDKAVDLHLFKQALEAKHFKNWKILFDKFLDGYKKISSEQVQASSIKERWAKESKKILERLIVVEKRGRYKGS
jgi:TP53 regulating kinase-like protein